MKVNAGLFKNRILKRTNLETTRETSDMVKQAIFNMIGPFFYDKEVALDLFAGSGALGLESLSRGMSYVYFNDLNKHACNIIKDNLDTLNVKNSQYTLTNLDYLQLLKKIDKKVDYVFLDPPYDLKNINEILDKILEANILSNKALIVFEMHKETNHHVNNSLNIIKEKAYGIKKVIIYQYTELT